MRVTRRWPHKILGVTDAQAIPPRNLVQHVSTKYSKVISINTADGEHKSEPGWPIAIANETSKQI